MTFRRALALACAAAAMTASPAAAAPLHSDNVSRVAKLPEAVGAASARFSPDGGVMYVSTWKGLHTYDVSKPAQPKQLGFLALPHFENEDVDAGDGVVIISNDPSEGLGLIYVIDVRDPAKPTIRSVIRNGDILGVTNELGLDETQSNTGHIANCLQGCRWLWTTGTSEGIAVFDLRDLANPKFVKTIPMPVPVGGDDPGFTHDVYIDPTGIAWITGKDGTFGYTTDDPANPQLRFRTDENVVNSGTDGPFSPDTAQEGPLDFLHHNSMCTGIQLGKGKTAKRVKRGTGDVMAITEEDYTRPTCKGQGSFQTWQIRPGETNSDGSTKLSLLDQWTTELNGLADQTGRSPATVLCSAHWFDERHGLLAQGWYDQGVRFLDLSDPKNIRQVGYWVTSGTFWAAYYAPRDPSVVYGLDITSGIDVLKLGGPKKASRMKRVKAPVRKRWLKGGGSRFSAKADPTWGFACPLLASARRL